MKKILSILMTLVFAMSMITGCSAAENTENTNNGFVLTMQIGNPMMNVNGESREIDPGRGTVPVAENDRTLVPIRAIIEAMGGTVNWDEETQTVTITKSASTTITPTIQPSSGGKTLVVYYSASGNTEEVANYIAKAANADIFELEPVEEYSAADLDWTDETSRVNDEHNDESKRDIELKATSVTNWSEYDNIFIGYPIWWGIAAWPVDNFVKGNDFTGKKVIPFCTSASSGLGQSGELLADMAGTGDWQTGMRFRSGASESEVVDWVNTLNLNTASQK